MKGQGPHCRREKLGSVQGEDGSLRGIYSVTAMSFCQTAGLCERNVGLLLVCTIRTQICSSVAGSGCLEVQGPGQGNYPKSGTC